MKRDKMIMRLASLFKKKAQLNRNLIVLQEDASEDNQKLTNKVFSQKWKDAEQKNIITGRGLEFQKSWYLSLYGFKAKENLQRFLISKEIILDAGCGLGYKSALFAQMSPKSLVIGMDFSDAVFIAKEKYKHLKNLFFIKGDIANTDFKKNSIDYVSCDQVIHHTTNPEATFKHLRDITKCNGQFACYVYSKKSLPRELVDDYFRCNAGKHTTKNMWKFAEQLTALGKALSELKISFDCPEIPILGIKEGRYDIQRFIYWNFLKCFWNEGLGRDYSISTNFDWYTPKNAKRYSEREFKDMIRDNNLKIIYFHREEACYSGRFKKVCSSK